MSELQEIIFDYDRSVGTEDRFAIRRFVQSFVEIASRANKPELELVIADGATTTGITEFPLQKPELVELFYKKFFGRRHNYFVMPKLKLTYNQYLFHLNGNYEEYEQGILSGSGTIEMLLIKKDDTFNVVGLKYYPRMLKQGFYD